MKLLQICEVGGGGRQTRGICTREQRRVYVAVIIETENIACFVESYRVNVIECLIVESRVKNHVREPRAGDQAVDRDGDSPHFWGHGDCSNADIAKAVVLLMRPGGTKGITIVDPHSDVRVGFDSPGLKGSQNRLLPIGSGRDRIKSRGKSVGLPSDFRAIRGKTQREVKVRQYQKAISI